MNINPVDLTINNSSEIPCEIKSQLWDTLEFPIYCLFHQQVHVRVRYLLHDLIESPLRDAMTPLINIIDNYERSR